MSVEAEQLARLNRTVAVGLLSVQVILISILTTLTLILVEVSR